MACLFCKILEQSIPADIIYEDDEIIAFNDINPRAPTHTLIIPREHIPTINELQESHASLAGKMVLVAQALAQKANIADSGYRLVFNCNDDGGQEVHHLHLHLIGGRPMTWPPG